MSGLIDTFMKRRSFAIDVLTATLVFLAAGSLALHLDGPGEPVAGALWVRLTYAVGLGTAILLRRRQPLLASMTFWGVVALQAISTGASNEGLHMIIGIGVITYSSGRYGDRWGALLGIVIHLLGYGAYTWWNADFQAGAQGDMWAIGFFAVYGAVLWLLGWAVRSHHDRAEAAREAGKHAAAAASAVSAERSRIARELHDVVSHQLSVVVVQAAGARAQHPDADSTTLQKIENSGREALAEMRRMLDVLRADDSDDDLAPTPDLDQLRGLVDTIRSAGVPVELSIDDEVTPVSPGVALTVFRLVQESLTNTLKHSRGASARVRVARDGVDLLVEITDDGSHSASNPGGHGLVGMRERVSLLGGTFEAGPTPGRGFRVRAQFPAESPAR